MTTPRGSARIPQTPGICLTSSGVQHTASCTNLQHKSCPRLCTGAEDKAEASPCLSAVLPPAASHLLPPLPTTQSPGPNAPLEHQPAGKTLGSRDPLQDVGCEQNLTGKSLASSSLVSS